MRDDTKVHVDWEHPLFRDNLPQTESTTIIYLPDPESSPPAERWEKEAEEWQQEFEREGEEQSAH